MKQQLNKMKRKSDLPFPVMTPTSSVASSCPDTPLSSNLPTSMYSSSVVSNHHDSLTHDTSVLSAAFPSTVTTHLLLPLPCSDLLSQLCNLAPAFCQMIDPLVYPDHFMSIFSILTYIYQPLCDPNKFVFQLVVKLKCAMLLSWVNSWT